MLTFSQYLNEAGDTAIPFKYNGVTKERGEGGLVYHTYSFKHGGRTYNAFYTHKVKPEPHVSVTFSRLHTYGHGTYNLTHGSGPAAIKILSTIHNITKNHLAKHPEVKEIRFTSNMDEPSRVKLYTKYAEKHGGQTVTPDDDEYTHIIPASAYRSQINEAGEAPLPFTRGEVISHGETKHYNYSFNHNGKEFRTIIHHDNPRRPVAEVEFSAHEPGDDKRGVIDLTGEHGHHATRILSTMHNIVKQHISEHPHIKKVEFTSYSNEPTRAKLYTAYTRRLNGTTEHEDGDGTYIHSIPASSYHSRVNESDESTRIQLRRGGSDEKAKAFLSDFENDSDEHPFHRSARILHGSVVDLSKDGSNIHVHDIASIAPRTGAGTKALKHLTGLADKHGVKLNLFAKAYSKNPEHITSTKKLIKWYEKHKFKHDERDYDPDYGSEMTYYPKL